jgi:Tfp pilus assembly protein PilO
LTLIQDLEKLAQQNNLKQKLSLDQIENSLNEKIYSLSLGIELVGNYPDILNYLNEINKFDYKLIINILELKNEASALKLNLLASTYWLYAENKNP